jgi:hypothetical protein
MKFKRYKKNFILNLNWLKKNRNVATIDSGVDER